MRLKARPGEHFENLLAKTVNVPCEFQAPKEPPEWLNKGLFDAGRKCYDDYSFAFLLSTFMVACANLALPNICYPFAFTRKTENIQKTFVRMSKLLDHLEKMFQELVPWEDLNLMTVTNAYHVAALRKIQQQPWYHLKQKGQQNLREAGNTLNSLDLALLESLDRIKRENPMNLTALNKYKEANIIFSQWDIAVDICASFSFLSEFPQLFGFLNVPRESLKGYFHFWRVVVYYMGVDDDSNIIKDNLNQTREIMSDVEKFIVLPSTLHMDSTSIFLGKNFASSFKLDYHLCMYFYHEGYGFELKELWQEFSWKLKFMYYMYKLFFRHLYSIPFIRWLTNKAVKFLNGMAIKEAKEMKIKHNF